MGLSVANGPEPTGLMELLPKMQGTKDYFVLLFKGWNTNDKGEKYADIEIIIQGFGKEDVTLDDLGDFLEQIGDQMH